MDYFKESSYANLLFKNGTILTTITTTTNIPTRKTTTATSHTIVAKKNHLCYLCLLSTMGKVSRLLVGLESSFWGQIGVEFNFQSIGAHYRCGGRIRAAH